MIKTIIELRAYDEESDEYIMIELEEYNLSLTQKELKLVLNYLKKKQEKEDNKKKAVPFMKLIPQPEWIEKSRN